MLDALIIGGDSQIGKALAEKLRSLGWNTATTTRKWPPIEPSADVLPFDLRWPTYLPQAKVTYFSTGINGFKPCDADPEEAKRINVTLLLAVARRLAYTTRLVFLSSSAAETHPLTVYGQCKLAAERGFLEYGGVCFRFGPVAFPGRNVYPNEIYSPMNLSTLTRVLSGCLHTWKPKQVHSLYNRDWKPE